MQQRADMAAAKAKKKRKAQRKLDRKKKKSKLKEPIKESEREATVLKNLRLAMAHFGSQGRAGKGVSHENVDPGDEKTLKALQRYTPSGDPTTTDSDMAVLKLGTPRLRKERADSSMPRIEQQREMRVEIRALPSQKPPPSDVRSKSPIPIKVQQSCVNLPTAAFSQVPPTASERLVFCQRQPPRAKPQPEVVSAVVKILLKFSSPLEHSSKFNANSPINLRGDTPNSQLVSYGPSVLVHGVMVYGPSVSRPQATVASLQPPLGSRAHDKQPASNSKRDDTQRNVPIEWYGWCPVFERFELVHCRVGCHGWKPPGARTRSNSLPSNYRFQHRIGQDTPPSSDDHLAHPVETRLRGHCLPKSFLSTLHNRKSPMESLNTPSVHQLTQTTASISVDPYLADKPNFLPTADPARTLCSIYRLIGEGCWLREPRTRYTLGRNL